ncbi:hypothetical protein [Nonomuraea aurantiaca]|uniref:hypothetical protein n=1 Tax=Nonomuraea aurantiaca TaxID=2878562 RepID=UPI001CDA03C2|nr:hypothetical protein [Nonomuraea aurantiaca]MCA2229617.1 hypothetical protein [Nonomuraea aurantiaca]
MSGAEPEKLRFPGHFSHAFTYGESGAGVFGIDALRSLTDGIDQFLADPDGRWTQYRSLGAAMLGCVPWFDDPQLLDRVVRFPAACVVVTKQELSKRGRPGFEALKRHAERGPGFPAWAFSALTDLVSRYDGDLPVVGPASAPLPGVRIQSFRSIGFRKAGGTPVPILHAKMFLLGHLWWHDEHPEGFVADVMGFTPKRLWLGSANGTRSSRLSLDFGIWIDDPGLLRHAQEFLVRVLRHSESIDPDDDLFDPEFVDVEYDDEAFWEYIRDLEPADNDPDEEVPSDYLSDLGPGHVDADDG